MFLSSLSFLWELLLTIISSPLWIWFNSDLVFLVLALAVIRLSQNAWSYATWQSLTACIIFLMDLGLENLLCCSLALTTPFIPFSLYYCVFEMGLPQILLAGLVYISVEIRPNGFIASLRHCSSVATSLRSVYLAPDSLFCRDNQRSPCWTWCEASSRPFRYITPHSRDPPRPIRKLSKRQEERERTRVKKRDERFDLALRRGLNGSLARVRAKKRERTWLQFVNLHPLDNPPPSFYVFSLVFDVHNTIYLDIRHFLGSLDTDLIAFCYYLDRTISLINPKIIDNGGAQVASSDQSLSTASSPTGNHPSSFAKSLEELRHQHEGLISSPSTNVMLLVQLEELQKKADALDHEGIEEQRARRREFVIELEASLRKLEEDGSSDASTPSASPGYSSASSSAASSLDSSSADKCSSRTIWIALPNAPGIGLQAGDGDDLASIFGQLQDRLSWTLLSSSRLQTMYRRVLVSSQSLEDQGVTHGTRLQLLVTTSGGAPSSFESNDSSSSSAEASSSSRQPVASTCAGSSRYEAGDEDENEIDHEDGIENLGLSGSDGDDDTLEEAERLAQLDEDDLQAELDLLDELPKDDDDAYTFDHKHGDPEFRKLSTDKLAAISSKHKKFIDITSPRPSFVPAVDWEGLADRFIESARSYESDIATKTSLTLRAWMADPSFDKDFAELLTLAVFEPIRNLLLRIHQGEKSSFKRDIPSWSPRLSTSEGASIYIKDQDVTSE